MVGFKRVGQAGALRPHPYEFYLYSESKGGYDDSGDPWSEVASGKHWASARPERGTAACRDRDVRATRSSRSSGGRAISRWRARTTRTEAQAVLRALALRITGRASSTSTSVAIQYATKAKTPPTSAVTR